MNPLAWPGPSFLLFYGVVGAATLLLLWILQRKRESGRPPHIDATDPYLIAYLRGGENEVARIAVISLIHRGLLAEQGKNVGAQVGNDFQGPAVEATILHLFATPRASMEILDGSMKGPCIAYERVLTQLGLLPDSSARAARTKRLALAVSTLLGFAIAKTMIAPGSGHSIIFLVVLASFFCWLCIKIVSRRRTKRGDDSLDDLQRLLHPRKARAAIAAGGANADLTLLIALFGLSALSATQFAYAERIFATSKANGGGGGCGGGGDGGGGGGGCGGGCGGCGGGGD